MCYKLTYLLSLYSSTYDRLLCSPDSNIMAAFGQRYRLVYSIASNGGIQMVPMETIRGGNNVLHRTVAEAPVLTTVVSSRGTPP